MYELLVKNGKIVTADSVKEGDTVSYTHLVRSQTVTAVFIMH